MANKLIPKILLLFLIFFLSTSNSLLCSDRIKSPCSCLSLPSQKIAVICLGGNSLEHILDAIQPLQDWPESIEILRLEDTPIPLLYLDSLGPILSSSPIRRFVLRNNSLSKFLFRPNFAGPPPLFLETVEHLEISKNEIAQFSHCPGLASFRNLRVLSLSTNLLGRIPPHIFLHFHSRRTLQQLDLSANWLSERGLPPEAFLGLESLQKLSLDKNQLSRVPTEAVAELAESLEELFLSANQIDGIEPGDFPPLPRLKSLGLDVNQISWLDGHLFRAISSLSYLYLGQNQFASLPPNMLAFLPELKVLAMGGNPLDRLEAETFQSVPSLLRLDLSNCRIRQIHVHSFGPIPRLQFLNLRGNRLDRIQRGLFTGKLPFLVSLDLARNQLVNVEDLSGFGQLEFLDLSGNGIASFGPKIFLDTFRTGAANLEMLNLEGNPIDCDPPKIEWLLTLQRGIRVKGNCGQPAELRGKPLAHLSGQMVRQIPPKRTTAATTKMASLTTKNKERVAMMATTMSAILRPTSSILLNISRQSILANSTVKMVESNFSSQNGKMGRESSWAILFMVVAFVSLGLFLVCLLAFRPLLLGQCPANAQNGCFRLKHFGPSKSFAPSNNYSPSSIEPSPALLTTLNHLKTINSCPQMANKRHQNSIFNMENGNDRRDRWRIQRELFWF